MVLRKVNESSKAVMDSTFYLAPHACSAAKKNGNVQLRGTTTNNHNINIFNQDKPVDKSSYQRVPWATKNRNGRATGIRHSFENRPFVCQSSFFDKLGTRKPIKTVQAFSLKCMVDSHSIDFNNGHVIGKRIFLFFYTLVYPDMPQLQLNGS